MPRRLDSRLTRQEMGHLHMWPKELGLDEQVRQDIQRQVTGHESCRDMTYGDYLKLARHYNQLRAGQRADRQARPRNAGYRASATLRALYGAIQTRGDRQGLASVAALEKIVRMLDLPRGQEEEHLNQALAAYVRCQHWRWLTPKGAYDMIEALKARAARQRRSA